VTYGSYASAAASALAFIREWSSKGEILLLAATRASADALVRAACDTAVVGVHRLTLRELAIAGASHAMNARGLAPVHQIAREALAARVTAQALRESRLSYFAAVAEFPGFPRSLASTLEMLRLNHVAPQALCARGASGTDLAVLLELYVTELRERSLADHATRVEIATEAVRHGTAGFGTMPVLLWDVTARSETERELLNSVTANAPATLHVKVGQSDAEPSSGLESLQRYVLSGEVVPPRAADASVAIFSASGESLECAEIARRIVSAAREGTRFDSVGILLRSGQRYEPLVAEALRRAGIPGYFSRGTRRPDAAGRAFLALLLCAAENHSAARFAEYLSLGQLPRENRELRAPVRWERLLVDAAVIGGAGRWKRRLAGLIEESITRHNASDDPAERGRYLHRIEALESLEAFALPIIERLESLPMHASWGEWLDALNALAATLRAPETVHELLEELSPMSDVGPVDLAGVLLVLRERLTDLRGNRDPDPFGKVFVGTIEEARGMSFRHVFVPGLNEGIFPRPVTEDPLLLDGQRQALGLATSADDGELLRIACACASERIVFSWSRLDLLTGRARVPSFYAFEAIKAARGSVTDVRTFEQEAQSGTETRIGWPAPASPDEAIDDLEYDLACLRPSWDTRVKGEGAYLTRINEHAVRSLRARWIRWKKPWKWADGFVDPDMHVLAMLGEHRPSKRAWSVSALQQYARCPYRFLLRGIYQLEPAEQPEPIQRLDPVTRGEVYHRVQFELLRDLSANGLLPIADVPAVLDKLAVIVARISADYEERLAPAIPQVWAAEIESIHADLRGWVHYKAAVESEWMPELFEFSFGLKDKEGHDPASVPEAIEALPGLLLRGSIDLVERHAAGMQRVVDHKTGRVPDRAVESIGGGEHLQPVLYALAAERALKNAHITSGRLFYSTLRQNYRAVDIPIHDGSRQRAEQAVGVIDRALDEGFLPAAPRKDGCKGCEYLVVCGPWEEERVAKKSPAELRPLFEIRRTP
jgi:CRISPR/Cas system-associated exonuclease Cas4 (RecB family)